MSEEDEQFQPRLDQIETEWTLFRNAHQTSQGLSARNSLVLRYASAIRAYIKALTQNDVEADELSQDVVVRLLNGDFAGADPNRGRFRDLLKTAVKNMVRNHWAKQSRRRPVEFDLSNSTEATSDPSDEQWDNTWRSQVLEICWSRLLAMQESKAGSVVHSALKIRTDNPELDSTELAERLSTAAGRSISAANFRQQLRRSRIRFAELVVEEVANGLDTGQPIHEELIAVGLYEHIKDVLPAKWHPNSDQ